MEIRKFDWRLPLYGSLGFLIGAFALVFVIWLILPKYNISPTQGGVVGLLVGIVVFGLWGMIGGLFMGFGLDKNKAVRIAFAECIGFLVGISFIIIFEGVLISILNESTYPMSVISLFSLLVSFLGLFLGIGMKNKNFAFHLAIFGLLLGALLGMLVWILEIVSASLNTMEILPWEVWLESGALIGLVLGFEVAYFKSHPPPNIFPEDKNIFPKIKADNKYLKAVKFISASFLFGVILTVFVIVFYPTEIIEPVCDYDYNFCGYTYDCNCSAQIITRNQLFIDSGVHYSPVTQFKYTRENKTFITDYWDKDIRLSLEWIRQNTEKEAKFLNWWDYGHLIRGYAGRETIVYAPSLEGYTRMCMGRECANENILCEEAKRKAIDNWNTETLGNFSQHEKIIDVGYALLTDNTNETLQIMDKYNSTYLYIHSSDAGKSYSICTAIDDYYMKMKGYSCHSIVELKQEDYIKYYESNYSESEKYCGIILPEMFKNTTIGRALKNKEIEGLELVYHDMFSVIYKRV